MCQLKGWLLEIQCHSWQAYGQSEESNEVKRRHYDSYPDPKSRGTPAPALSGIYTEGRNCIHICSSVNPEKSQLYWHQDIWKKKWLDTKHLLFSGTA